MDTCGEGTPDLWLVRLSEEGAPALQGRLHAHSLRLGDLLRDPTDRDHLLDVVPLMLLRDGERVMTPAEDVVLRLGDVVLFGGRLSGRAALDTTLAEDPTASYVIDGRRVQASWVWRRLTHLELSRKVGMNRVGRGFLNRLAMSSRCTSASTDLASCKMGSWRDEESASGRTVWQEILFAPIRRRGVAGPCGPAPSIWGLSRATSDSRCCRWLLQVAGLRASHKSREHDGL